MANNQRKKKKSIQFEMGILGFLGLGVVTFMVLVWVFLLGIWAGQTILQPESGDKVAASSGVPPDILAKPAPAAVAQAKKPDEAKKPMDESPEASEPDEPADEPPEMAAASAPETSSKASDAIQPPQAQPEAKSDGTASPADDAKAAGAGGKSSSSSSSSSFFSLQVAAFSDAERADKEVAAWRARGKEAFSLPPEEGGDGLYRVCVGRFAELADANREASRLDEAENIKTFITLVPKARQP